MQFLSFENRRRKFSAERLRCLYIHLLKCIDINNDDLCLRGVDNSSGKNFFFTLPRRCANRPFAPVTGDEDQRTALKKQELAAAFRLIAATRSGENEHGINEARTDASAQAIKIARKLESTVVKIIQEIGSTVVSAERAAENVKTDLRDDDTFAYFCEKAILALLVEIANDKPGVKSTNVDEGSPTSKTKSCFHGVVWSPKVKAQVLHTISLLVSGVRDTSALYYILSQHCINQLILSMLPLTQWTDPALEDMLSTYADLLKTLSLQLGGSPELFPFFTVQTSSDTVASFPLYSAIIQMATSSYAQSDSYVHATCLNLIVGLMRIADASVNKWICQAEREQYYLCNHVCNRLSERCKRIANLTTGPVVDAVRSNSASAHLMALDDQIDVLNDLFCCNLGILNVRLCETLLRRFVAVLLRDILPCQTRKFLSVGVADNDVVPDLEAAAQASCFVLSRMFHHLEYIPFLRMLAVVLFHPKSSMIWETLDDVDNTDEFACTKALNSLVQGKEEESISNPFRGELLSAISGEYGTWRVVTSAVLLESAITALDDKTLTQLDVLPSSTENDPAIEAALVTFLSRRHLCESAVSISALECVSSLVVQYLHRAATALLNEGQDSTSFSRQSTLPNVLRSARAYFFEKTLESKNALQVNDIFVDVVESVVRARYKSHTKTTRGVAKDGFSYHLAQYGSIAHGAGAEPLVRKIRGVVINDVERTRFFAQMAIHFRAVCNIVSDSREREANSPTPDFVDEARDLCLMFGCLLDKPSVGTDLNLRGRMTFQFSVEASDDKPKRNGNEYPDSTGMRRTYSDEMILRASSDLILVLDPTDMFVVKPFSRREVNRGTIICCIPLLDVVAAAADQDRLHVAVRHGNVGCLIKNGNMVLNFESPGTCLIVAQYLDRCRNVLRQELYELIVKLFSATSPTEEASMDADVAADLVKRVRTF